MSESARFIATSYAHRNQILKALGFGSYRAYTESLKWFMIRNQVIGKRTVCRTCAEPAHAVHHEFYSWDNLIGVSLEGLHPICDKCHRLIETDREGQKIFDFTEINRRWAFLQKYGRDYTEARMRMREEKRQAPLRTCNAAAMPKESQKGVKKCGPTQEWTPRKPKFRSRLNRD